MPSEEPGQDDADGDMLARVYESTLRLETDDGQVLADLPPAAMPPPAAESSARTGRAVGVVARWLDDEGWGVMESSDLPGGCWIHFSVVDVPGYRRLRPGQDVTADWEEADQDGFRYRATRVTPVRAADPPGSPATAE